MTTPNIGIKFVKTIIVGFFILLSNIFLISGCGSSPENPKAIALDKIEIQSMVKDIAKNDDPSISQLKEYSEKLATLPNDEVYNEILNMQDSINAYIEANQKLDQLKEKGAKKVSADEMKKLAKTNKDYQYTLYSQAKNALQASFQRKAQTLHETFDDMSLDDYIKLRSENTVLRRSEFQ